MIWNRPSVSLCQCGADFTSQGGRQRCSKELSNVLLALRAKLYGSSELQAFPAELGFLEHLDLYSLSRFAFVLCEVVKQYEGTFEDRDLPEETYLERVAWMLTDWPTNFRAFIEKHYEGALKADGRPFRETFAWAFFRLQKNLKQRGRLFAFLTDELCRIGAQYLTRDRITRGAKAVSVLPSPERWGSVPEAAAIIGMDPRTVMVRIISGKFPAKKVAVGKRNRNYMVDLDWARQWKYSKYPSISVRDAAKRLGITVNLLCMLRRMGVYKVHFHTLREKGYSREDIDSFEAVLLDLAAHHSANGLIPGIAHCGVTLSGSVGMPSKAKMLQALIERRRLENGAVEQAQSVLKQHQECYSGSTVHVEVALA